jgi:hypothetical protein
MLYLFMIALDSFDDKHEQEQLSELIRKAYMGIETLANGFENNFRSLLQTSPVNLAFNGLLDKQFSQAVDECIRTKDEVISQVLNMDEIALQKISLTGAAMQLKLQILNINLLRLEKNYCDYSLLSVAKDLSNAIVELLAILEKLSIILQSIIPLINMLQLVQSLLRETARVSF